jgi:hypothetical protein
VLDRVAGMSSKKAIGAGLVKTLLDRGYNAVANSRKISKSGAFETSV